MALTKPTGKTATAADVTPDVEEAVDEEERRRRQREKNQGAIEFLRSLRDVSQEEADDQRETWEYLRRVLDEDRLSERKLFP